MKNRSASTVSSSGDSDEGLEMEKTSTSRNSATNNLKSSDSSDSSSDSERRPGGLHSSTLEPVKSKKNTTKINGGSPLKRFTTANPDLVKQESSVQIDEYDDVCFLEVPKSLDVEQFLGKSVNFDRRTKIKINKVKYVIEPTDESIKPITLFTKKLQVIHPVARLQLREYIKHKNNLMEVEPVKFKPSLPKNLKVRHPLFGAEYKKKIVLSEEIEKKLDNTIDSFVKKMKNKKKHKEKSEERKHIKQEKPSKNEAIFTLLESHSPSKKKKYRKEAATDVEDAEEGNRHKKINIINSTVISGRHTPPFEFDMSEIEHKEITEKTKKKKNKSVSINHEEDIDDESLVRRDKNDTDYDTDSPRKKKKRYSQLLDSKVGIEKKPIKQEPVFALQLPSFEYDVARARKNTDPSPEEEVNEFNSEKKKKEKKKKKKEKSLDESEYETEREVSPRKRKHSALSQHAIEEVKIKKEKKSDSDESSSKKKRKKVKQESETDSLIMNLLTMVKGEIDESTDGKKRKKPKSGR